MCNHPTSEPTPRSPSALQVYVTCFADGPTRVLRFSDDKNVSSLEAQNVILDLAGRLKQARSGARGLWCTPGLRAWLLLSDMVPALCVCSCACPVSLPYTSAPCPPLPLARPDAPHAPFPTRWSPSCGR